MRLPKFEVWGADKGKLSFILLFLAVALLLTLLGGGGGGGGGGTGGHVVNPVNPVNPGAPKASGWFGKWEGVGDAEAPVKGGDTEGDYAGSLKLSSLEMRKGVGQEKVVCIVNATLKGGAKGAAPQYTAELNYRF